MVVEGATTAKQSFIELAKADTSGDYDKALKIANRIIQKFPRETLAFKCKLVALIQLGKFEDALAFANRIPFHQMGDCVFEKAYIQYRLNDDSGAMKTVEAGNPEDVRCLELKAQLLYRAERFQEAADVLKQVILSPLRLFLNVLLLYYFRRKLLRETSDDYDEVRRANLIAVIAQLQGMGQNQPIPEQLETFEQLYNGACYLIEAGNFKNALRLLEDAEKLCSSYLNEEGFTEEECEDELAVIRVQKAFVLQKLGRSDEALEIYLQLQKTNPSDKSVVATLNNNFISSRRSVNMLEARRKLKVAMQTEASKLTSRQRRTLALNQALLCMLSNQKEPCNKALQEIRQKYGMVQEALIIEAALHLRCKEPQKAIAVLDSATPTTEVYLAKVQIYLNDGKIQEALDILNNLPSNIGLRPAILQLRVALWLILEKKKEALDLLKSVIGTEGSNVEALLEQAASLNLQCEDYRAAVECLERLAALKPGDLKVMCRLIRAYSAFDVARAEELSAQIFPKSADYNIDVDALEKSDLILYKDRSRQKKEAKQQEPDTEIITGKLRRRKRKRKPLLPKNFDPRIPPDPERWLPRQERTAYKKRINKKHRDRDIGRGTQGAVSSPVQFESTKTKPENSPKPTPVMGTEGPRQQRPAGQQPKKKKKKTGKW